MRAPSAGLLGSAVRAPGLRALAIYAAGALVAAAPVLPSLGSEFVVDEGGAHDADGEAATGDHLQSVYRLWLVGHQLGRAAAPWVDPYSFRPESDGLVVLGGLPVGLLFWPLDALLGPVLAWNLLLLASIVVGGLAVRAWLRLLGLPDAAALVGGLVFALAPYRIAQSGGHFVGWALVFLPVSLWAFERARASRGGGRHAGGLVAAAAFASIALSGQLQLTMVAAPFAVAYALVRFRPVPAAWLGAGVLAAVGVGAAYARSTISDSVASGGRRLAEVTFYSADWIDFVSRSRQRGLEQYVFLGWLTLALALAGVAVAVRRSAWLGALLAAGVLVPAVLALGTNTPVFELLRDVVPGLEYPRVPTRFMGVSVLALAALCAFALAAVAGRVPPRRRPLLAAAAVVAVGLDLITFSLRGAEADAANATYRVLAAEEPRRMLELPILLGLSGHHASTYDYYVMQAPVERPSGYSSVAPVASRRVLVDLARLSCGDDRPGDRARLADLGVTHVTVHRPLFARSGIGDPRLAEDALRRLGYRPVAVAEGEIALFRAAGAAGAAGRASADESPQRSPILCTALASSADSVAVVWLHGPGSATIVLTRPRAAPTAVALDGRAVSPVAPGEEELTVSGLGAGWHRVTLRSTGAPALLVARVVQGPR